MLLVSSQSGTQLSWVYGSRLPSLDTKRSKRVCQIKGELGGWHARGVKNIVRFDFRKSKRLIESWILHQYSRKA